LVSFFLFIGPEAALFHEEALHILFSESVQKVSFYRLIIYIGSIGTFLGILPAKEMKK